MKQDEVEVGVEVEVEVEVECGSEPNRWKKRHSKAAGAWTKRMVVKVDNEV